MSDAPPNIIYPGRTVLLRGEGTAKRRATFLGERKSSTGSAWDEILLRFEDGAYHPANTDHRIIYRAAFEAALVGVAT